MKDLVLYLVVNDSLNMGCGKIAAQCGHAVHLYMNKIHELTNYSFFYEGEMKDISNKILDNHYNWNNHKEDGYKKIVLKANKNEFDNLKQEYVNRSIFVTDAGLTEVEKGSETVIAIFPITKDERSKTLKRLRLL
jgi:peptidyl-tRNA hydrolase